MKIFLLLSLLLVTYLQSFGQRQTLGAPINTREHSEFAPAISADGKTLIFESDRSGKGWRLYVSRLIANAWTEPEDVKVINNAVGPNDFLGGPCLSNDGNMLFFTSNMKGSVGGVDIWYSEFKNNQWSTPKNFGPTLNSRGYDGFPSISPDGDKLYFMRAARDKMPSGQQCCQIYVAHRQGKFFIKPKPLPYPVNTGCEGYPRIMGDGHTLIFSSYKTKGKGGYDLYQSRLKYGKWTKPVPLNFINTDKDDELVSVPSSGDVIYFSGQSNGKEDIYKIEIPKNLRPEQVVSFEGMVTDDQAKPIPAQIRINNLKTGQKVAKTDNNPETGAFKVLLEKGEKYDIAITAKGYSFNSEMINTINLAKSHTISKKIVLKPLKKETEFTLNNIFFDFDSASLTKDSYFELKRVLDLLNQNPTLKVEIAAHTDDKGSDEYNDWLSQERAESVVNYLTGKGILKTRLVAKGYGKRKPAFPNDSDENRAKNRRVEFKVLGI